jgi:hypothetical protein
VIKRSAFCVLVSAEALLSAGLGCDPHVVIGSYPAAATADAGTDSEAGPPGAGGGMGASAGMGGTMTTMPDAGQAGELVVPSGGSGGEGALPTLLWSTSHEAADLSDWEPEGGWYTTDLEPVVTDSIAHSGQYSVACSIETGDGTSQVVRIYRSIVDQPAYYSAWFYLDQVHLPDQWWSLFVFLVAEDVNDPDTLGSVWDMNLRNVDGELFPYVYSHLTEENTELGGSAVPVGEWAHFEFFLDYSPPAETTMRFWLNGALAFETSLPGEVPGPFLTWGVGNGSDGLSPLNSTLYIDDAAISTVRLGP